MEQGTCVLGEGECSTAGKIVNGWCQKHYQRLRKRGDPFATPRRIFGDDIARFWSYVNRGADDECWLWTGHVDDGGYGVIGIGKKLRKVHLWAYETFVGEVPPDRPRLDHACHTADLSCPAGVCDHRRCVNYVRHLEPVTDAENARRSHQIGKITDEEAIALHARWLAGEPVVLLAASVDMKCRSLYARFSRLKERGQIPPDSDYPQAV